MKFIYIFFVFWKPWYIHRFLVKWYRHPHSMNHWIILVIRFDEKEWKNFSWRRRLRYGISPRKRIPKNFPKKHETWIENTERERLKLKGQQNNHEHDEITEATLYVQNIKYKCASKEALEREKFHFFSLFSRSLLWPAIARIGFAFVPSFWL